MNRYRKKPVEIQAVQYTGDNIDEISKFMTTQPHHISVDNHSKIRGIAIPTREGEMLCSPGDWVIRGVKGEFYPCKPDIFEATYDAV